jgi:hypothetical protein
MFEWSALLRLIRRYPFRISAERSDILNEVPRCRPQTLNADAGPCLEGDHCLFLPRPLI